MAQCIFLELKKIKTGTDKNNRNWTMNIMKVRRMDGVEDEVSIFQPYNQEIYSNVTKLNPGDVVDVETEEKNGRRNIVEVKFIRRGKLEDAPASSGPGPTTGGVGGKTGFREPDEIIRGEAISQAIRFIEIVLANTEHFDTGLDFRAPVDMQELMFRFAQDAVDFAKGRVEERAKKAGAAEPKTKAEQTTTDDPELPDVPEPGDDDDIPF